MQQSSPLYFEKQSLRRCAIHAVNNLLQKPVYDNKSFDLIAQALFQLSQEETLFGMNPHKTLILGNYSADVICQALSQTQRDCVFFDNRKEFKIDNIATLNGFIIYSESKGFFGTKSHWSTALLKDNIFYLMNSKLNAPEQITQVELEKRIQKIINEEKGNIIIVYNK